MIRSLKQRLPKTGWQFVRLTDLKHRYGDAYEPGECERCGRTNLRFLHTMRHDEYGDLVVGCQCAVNLSINHDAKQVEQEAAAFFSRKQRFTTQGWQETRSGNIQRRWKGFSITIFADRNNPGTYAYCISKGRSRKARKWFRGCYPTKADAVLGAFAGVCDG